MVTTVPAGTASALPDSGTRIRLIARMPERERWIGPFVSVAHDTVTMRDGATNGALVTVPTLNVVRFEISRGNLPNGLRGAGIGFAVGALAGAGVGYASYTDNEMVSQVGEAVLGAVVLGVIGAAVGAEKGVRTHSERWRTLPLENLHGTARP